MKRKERNMRDIRIKIREKRERDKDRGGREREREKVWERVIERDRENKEIWYTERDTQ